MTPIGRRQFCAALSAGVAGLSVALLAGCSSGSDTVSSSNSTAADEMLAGLAFEVRRDPG